MGLLMCHRFMGTIMVMELLPHPRRMMKLLGLRLAFEVSRGFYSVQGVFLVGLELGLGDVWVTRVIKK